MEIKKKRKFLFSVAPREFSKKIKQPTPVEVFNQKILDASSTLAISTAPPRLRSAQHLLAQTISYHRRFFVLQGAVPFEAHALRSFSEVGLSEVGQFQFIGL